MSSTPPARRFISGSQCPPAISGLMLSSDSTRGLRIAGAARLAICLRRVRSDSISAFATPTYSLPSAAPMREILSSTSPSVRGRTTRILVREPARSSPARRKASPAPSASHASCVNTRPGRVSWNQSLSRLKGACADDACDDDDDGDGIAPPPVPAAVPFAVGVATPSSSGTSM